MSSNSRLPMFVPPPPSELDSLAARIARIGGWSFDALSRRLTCSDEVRAIFEVPPAAPFELDDARALITAASRPAMTLASNACLRQGMPFDVELRIVTMEGRDCSVRVVGEAILGPGDAIAGMRGAVQDVTAQRLAREMLERSEERFRIIARSTNDTIWDWDIASNKT